MEHISNITQRQQNQYQAANSATRSFFSKINQPKIKLISTIIILIIGAFFILTQLNNNAPQQTNNQYPIKVKTIVFGQKNNSQNSLISGQVQAQNQVNLIALSSGTVTEINFNLGQIVNQGDILARLSEPSVLTNLSSAQTNYQNAQQNLITVQNLTQENFNQAQLAVEQAQVSINTAQTALDNAQNNLNITQKIQQNTKQHIQTQAVIASYNYLNNINNVLNQINYILKVEDGEQLPGINNTLSAKSQQALINAKNSYLKARYTYNNLAQQKINTNNIINQLNNIVQNCQQTALALDQTLIVLDKTVPSSSFSTSQLQAQKNNFTNSRNNFTSVYSKAQEQLQNLQNIDTVQKQELHNLQANIESLKNQLHSAQINKQNAQARLESAKQNKTQQILTAQSQRNQAKTQLMQAQNQADKLTIIAPINGSITEKRISLGQEISPGTKLGQISQSGQIKIVINITPQQAQSLNLGQTWAINDNLLGTVSAISPVIDPISGKITVEITTDKNQNLVPGDFIKIKLPHKNQNTNLVPLSAVLVEPNQSFVFIAQNNKAIKKPITTGEIINNSVVVSNGLKPGDYVIISQVHKLNPNDKIINE